MAWLHASLLLGTVLAAAPVLLHLALKPRPRRLIFPAVRFVRQRRETNQRSLRLRQWLLLALRCLAVALLAVLWARPSTHESLAAAWGLIGLLGLGAVLLAGVAVAAWLLQRGRPWVLASGLGAALLALLTLVLGARAASDPAAVLLGDREAPLSAILVVDTSVRMDYVQANQSSLERAVDTARWLLEQLPQASEAAVLDTRGQPAAFSADLAAADQLVERLETSAASLPLPDLVGQALQLAEAAQFERKELYLFSDFSRAAWGGTLANADADSEPGGGLERLQEQLEQHPEISVYLIDVGAAEPQNRLLHPLRLSQENLPQGGVLTIDAAVEAVGAEAPVDATVELWIDENDATRPLLQDNRVLRPAMQKRAEQIVAIPPGQPAALQFQVKSLPVGVRHGLVRVAGADGLSIDNQRHFVVEVGRAHPILLVHPRGVSTTFVRQCLAPDEFRASGRAEFECTEVEQAGLGNQALADFAAVLLVDPEPLTEEQWTELAEYVEGGGGLAVLLGRNAQPTASFNGQAAQRLLPGPLLRQWRAADRELFFTPASGGHPLLREFQRLQSSTPWSRFAVFRHWEIYPAASDAAVVFRLANNNKPAVLDRRVGQGRVVTFTTPLSDMSPRGNPWNELAYMDNNWPPFLLLDQLGRYLVDARQSQLNFTLGETVVLQNDEEEFPDQYQIFTPDDRMQQVRSREGRLELRSLERPGGYYLKGQRGGVIVRGFAENLALAASDLVRVDPQEVRRRLGEDRVQLANRREDIHRVQDRQRVGREFFPFLLLAVAAMLALEHLLANRFYRPRPAEHSALADWEQDEAADRPGGGPQGGRRGAQGGRSAPRRSVAGSRS